MRNPFKRKPIGRRRPWRETVAEIRREYGEDHLVSEQRLDPPPVNTTRSIHGGVHCAPPGGSHNTCYRRFDGSCESCGYPPYAVENP